MEFYVSPGGDDGGPGSEVRPFRTIAHARDIIRGIAAKANEDITVYLRGGIYPVAEEIEFTGADSGQKGHTIIYENVAGETPVLDGGVSLSGWQKIPPPAVCVAGMGTAATPAGLQYYEAQAAPGANFRQLYVNGVKAVRARSDDASFLRPTPEGFAFDQSWLAALSDPGAMEVVVSPHEWQQCRLPVMAVDSHTLQIKPACWDIVKKGEYPGYSNPVRVENAMELLTRPGYWYLDRRSSKVYYIARPGELMSTAKVEAPRVERFFDLHGAPGNPVSNLRFSGIGFRMSTWLPGDVGLPASQANQPEPMDDKQSAIKAAIDCTWANNIAIDHCHFENLGGNGINLLIGCRECKIDHCQMDDVAGTAIQLGRGNMSECKWPPDDSRIVARINVSDCTIHNACNEYQSGCGLFAGMVQGCVIEHNELYDLPYSAISLGWGWTRDCHLTRGNRIAGNRIHDYLKVLADGGGIYCNGHAEDGVIEQNLVFGQHHRYATIYLDDGATNWTVRDNVCQKLNDEEWLLVKGHNNQASGNFTSSQFVRDMNDGLPPQNSVTGTTMVLPDNRSKEFLSQWPDEAQRVMRESGPRQ